MNEIHPLGSLIQEALDRNGWSLRHLSKRAADAGSPMSHTNLGRIKDEPVISIKAETIRMLAKILMVSESRVAQAALESMGIAHSGSADPSIEDVVRTSTELSEYDQQLLTAVLAVMRSNKGEANHDDQEQPEANPSGERAAGEARRSRGVISGQKTGFSFAPIVQSQTDDQDDEVPPIETLAAHPNFKTDRDRFDESHGAAGEESQEIEGDN
ncbi:hypothetical protein JTF08_13540 [Micrococcaceae bacterium RIT802]|nr:hypothetical protein [Micrococcaceae bacterium RIT 802]